MFHGDLLLAALMYCLYCEFNQLLIFIENSRPCWDLNPCTKPICYQLSYPALDTKIYIFLNELALNASEKGHRKSPRNTRVSKGSK